MKKNYGLIGYPLTHSMSLFIHKKLFGVSNEQALYRLYEHRELNDKAIKELKELNGFNITIPYKNKIIKYLKTTEEKAQSYQSVNTVSNTEHGFVGYNTDVYGFLKTIQELQADLSGNILILGAGGVAQMAVVETALRSGKITIAVREKSYYKAKNLAGLAENANKNVKINITDINSIIGDFDLLINCTPVGMYPDIDNCPVKESVIKRCKKVFDLIYNPAKTKLIQYAHKHNIPYKGGMSMLINQAAKAHEIWYGGVFAEKYLLEIEQKANLFMQKRFSNNLNNTITFIGFMASGKTTLAKAVAQELKLPYVDIDEEIENREKTTISQIFKNKGENYFRQVETQILSLYLDKQHAIISAGGGAPIYNEELLQKNSLVIYIDTPFEMCYKRIISDGDGRPIADSKQKEQLKELYQARAKVYEKIADMKIDGTQNLQQQILTIKEWI